MYKRPNCGLTGHNCKPINHNDNYVIVSAQDKEKCLPPSCFCERGELMRNGGFEIPGIEPGNPFAYWESLPAPESSVVRTTTNVYQGYSAASIRTNVLPQPVTRRVRLLQNVTVTPGCCYGLRFAERLVASGSIGTDLPTLIARVFYVYQGSQYDLLSKAIQKTKIDRHYHLHWVTAMIPVPCNVSGVIVQFDFFIPGTGGAEWNLDAVSLLALSRTSACCCKE
jgi:hypothetical protein